MKFGSLSLSEAQTLGRCNRPVVAGRLRADLTEFEAEFKLSAHEMGRFAARSGSPWAELELSADVIGRWWRCSTW